RRALGSQGRDTAGARGAIRGRAAERRGARSHDGRRGRGRADRGAGHRTVVGARIPARRARPARRLPPGDIALRRVIQRVYGFDHVPTEAELAEISDRWRPYRSLAVSYLFASEYDR